MSQPIQISNYDDYRAYVRASKLKKHSLNELVCGLTEEEIDQKINDDWKDEFLLDVIRAEEEEHEQNK